jgi:hypothetical protein
MIMVPWCSLLSAAVQCNGPGPVVIILCYMLLSPTAIRDPTRCAARPRICLGSRRPSDFESLVAGHTSFHLHAPFPPSQLPSLGQVLRPSFHLPSLAEEWKGELKGAKTSTPSVIVDKCSGSITSALPTTGFESCSHYGSTRLAGNTSALLIPGVPYLAFFLAHSGHHLPWHGWHLTRCLRNSSRTRLALGRSACTCFADVSFYCPIIGVVP